MPTNRKPKSSDPLSNNPYRIRTFSSDEEIDRRLAEEEEQTGRTRSSLIREALRKYLGLE